MANKPHYNKNQNASQNKDSQKLDRQSKTKGCRFHPDAATAVRHSSNDIAWYNKNPQLTKDVASVAFSNMLGLPMSFVRDNVTGFASKGEQTLPGLMKINYTPGVGVSKDGSSDVNAAARMIYSYVRHANSGSRNYEAPDLMTYILAMSSAYSYYAEMTRVYGLMRMYSHTNRYISKAIVQALGYDYDNFAQNLADFRAYINVFAAKINTFAVPKSLPLYDRQTWLPTSLFADSTSDRAQLYAFQPSGYYIWSGTAYDTGSALIYSFFTDTDTGIGNKVKFSDVVAFGDKIISALLTNEDIGIMSGDVLKAWGVENCRTIGQIDVDYSCPVLYDEMVLTQINNASIAGLFLWEDHTVNHGILDNSNIRAKDAKYDNNIHQKDGNIIYTPYAFASGTRFAAPTFDAKFSNPTPDYVMEGSRLMAICASKSVDLSITVDGMAGTYSIYPVEVAGSEIVNNLTYYVLSNGEVTSGTVLDTAEGALTGNTNLDASILQFEWSPHFYRSVTIGSSSVNVYLLTPVYNPVTFSTDTLKKMHNVALLSLLDINALGYKGM